MYVRTRRRPACSGPLLLPSIDRLFREWYAPLVRFARRRLSSADDAEDVAQEAFVRLSAREPRDARAWLFTVAGTLVADRRRTAARQERLLARHGSALHPDTSAPVEEMLITAERVSSVRQALDALAPRDRQLLLLHHDGRSYREIADELALAPSSIGSLLTRAHRRFLVSYEALHDVPASHRHAEA